MPCLHSVRESEMFQRRDENNCTILGKAIHMSTRIPLLTQDISTRNAVSATQQNSIELGLIFRVTVVTLEGLNVQVTVFVIQLWLSGPNPQTGTVQTLIEIRKGALDPATARMRDHVMGTVITEVVHLIEGETKTGMRR